MTLQEKEKMIVKLTQEIEEEKLAKDLNLAEGNYYSLYNRHTYDHNWFWYLTRPLDEKEIKHCLTEGDEDGIDYKKMEYLNRDGYTFAGTYCGGSWTSPDIVMYSEEKLIEYLPGMVENKFSVFREDQLKRAIEDAQEKLEIFYANKKAAIEQMEKFLKEKNENI